ncbi:MAG TPA: low-complexity protein, partial [Brevundimonas sp.]|nr:low-complexity protein [Brevundimonas sp.]
MSFTRRALGQGDVDMLVMAHERFVEGRAGGRRLSLKFMALDGLNLAGRNLEEADFTGCSLRGTRLSGARLNRAVLFCCDMREADLSSAQLVKADLRGACLRGADLARADLTQADFREGVIAVPHATKGLSSVKHETHQGNADGASFTGATLNGATLEGFSAFKVDFTDCAMKDTRLTRANLKDADLSGALMEG